MPQQSIIKENIAGKGSLEYMISYYYGSDDDEGLELWRVLSA